MNLNIYNNAIHEIEWILRGIREKIDKISREEWIKMEIGFHNGSFKSDDEAIGWNQMLWSRSLIENEKDSEVELLFYNIEIAKKRVKSVMDYIIKQEEDLSTLELICYASFSLMYFSMRNLKFEEINKLSDIIYDGILVLKITESDKEYIKKIWELVLRKMVYVYDYVECNCEWEESAEDIYNQDIQNILSEAYAINTDGEIVELFKEIGVVEKFFKEPSDYNLEQLKFQFFSKKENWFYHIFTCISPREWDIDLPGMHYLPHIKFCTSSNSEYLLMQKILRNAPVGYSNIEYLRMQKILGNAPVDSWENTADAEKLFWEEIDEWKEDAYKRIFAIPHEVNTKESKGELIYNVLYLLVQNKELEETKNAMVSDFTHRYKNYETDNIYNIANALITNPSSDELEDFGRELFLEYYNKQMMSREVAILSLEHKDNYEELRDAIKKSITIPERGINICDILDDALKRVLLRILLVNNETRMEDIRNKYEKKGIDTFDLYEQYENDILRGEKKCIEWVNKNMNPLMISISDVWNHLYFKQFSEGCVFLMSLLMELLLNIFTYADISYEINICFSTDISNDHSYLIIRTENKVDYKIRSNSRKGISSRNRILSKINYGRDYKWHDSLLKEYSEDKTECIVTARICADLLGGKLDEEDNSVD